MGVLPLSYQFSDNIHLEDTLHLTSAQARGIFSPRVYVLRCTYSLMAWFVFSLLSTVNRQGP